VNLEVEKCRDIAKRVMMKKGNFNQFSDRFLSILSLVVFISLSVQVRGTVKDSTNPSKLSSQDYAHGGKRSSEAARRVIPRLETEMYKSGVAVGNPVFIRVIKQTRELEVWLMNKQTKKYQEFKTYRIMGMSGKLGPKQFEGDMQAVEGFYNISRNSLNAQSRFHLSFNLGYPNRYDRAHGRTGFALMVHGNRVSAGCYAMTDYYVEEIYTLCSEALRNGQGSIAVHCFPFRMTDEKLKASQSSKWYGFWKNLKTGYDVFEKKQVPPKVGVSGRAYTFK